MNDHEYRRTWQSILAALVVAQSGCSDGLAPSLVGELTDTVQRESEGVYTRSLCPDAKAGARCGRIRVDQNGVPIRMSSPTAFSAPTLGATDLLQAYNVVRDTSHHPTVAVLAFGDYANAESDLGVYRAQYGLPACTSQSGCFTKINKNGATSPLPGATGALGEMMLDL